MPITEKLCELKIPVELYLYTGGEHGMSVENDLCVRDEQEKARVDANPNVALWVDMASNWLKQLA